MVTIAASPPRVAHERSRGTRQACSRSSRVDRQPWQAWRGQPHDMRSENSWMCEKKSQSCTFVFFFSGDGLFANWLNTIVRRSRFWYFGFYQVHFFAWRESDSFSKRSFFEIENPENCPKGQWKLIFEIFYFHWFPFGKFLDFRSRKCHLRKVATFSWRNNFELGKNHNMALSIYSAPRSSGRVFRCLTRWFFFLTRCWRNNSSY